MDIKTRIEGRPLKGHALAEFRNSRYKFVPVILSDNSVTLLHRDALISRPRKVKKRATAQGIWLVSPSRRRGNRPCMLAGLSPVSWVSGPHEKPLIFDTLTEAEDMVRNHPKLYRTRLSPVVFNLKLTINNGERT